MRKAFKTFFILFIGVFQACGTSEDCEDYACFTPPSSFMFELVDQSGENLFTNGTFEPDQIEITTLENNENIDFSFIDENNANVIQIRSIGWETETVEFSVSIGPEEIFQFYVDAERVSEDCCSFTRYNEIRIDNAEYEINEENGVYKILVE